MKGIWIILGIVVIAIIIVGAVLFTGSNNSGTGSTGGNQGSSAGAGSATTKEVEISGFAFSPATLTIKKGDTVKWTNQDSTRHTVTSDSGSELDSQSLGNGQSYSHTFASAGTFNYHCALHPNMKAKIIVE